MLRCRGPGITTLRELSHSAQAHCSHTGLGGTVSPIQDKPREKLAKSHINQTEKTKFKAKNIKSSKGKATNSIQWNPPKFIS